MKISLLLSAVFAAPNTELMEVLASLRDISASINELDLKNNIEVPDFSRLSKWKKNFDETAENGATSKFVRELEKIGRKMKLSLINAAIYKSDAASFDLRKLTGYGCFGTSLDREDEWIHRGTPVDEIDELGFKEWGTNHLYDKVFINY